MSLSACEPRSDSKERGASAETALPSIRWEIGQSYRYEFSIVAGTKIGGAPAGRLSVGGELLLSPLASQGNGVQQFAVDLTGISFKPSIGTDLKEYEPLRTELEESLGSFTLTRGSLSSQRLHQGATPVGANLLRSLVSYFQYPEAAGLKKDVREVDSTGAYLATYATGQGVGLVVETKTKYVSVNSKGYQRGNRTESPVPAIDSATVTYRLAEKRIAEVSATEAVSSTIQGKKALQATNEVKLALKEVLASEAISKNELEARTEDWPVDAPRLNRPDRSAFDTAQAADLSYKDALVQLVELRKDADPKSPTNPFGGRGGTPKERELRKQRLGQYQSAFSALTARLRIEPDSVDLAAKYLNSVSTFRRSESPTEQEMKASILVDALGVAGTEEAQARLLVLLLDEKKPAALRGQVASTLARAEVPSPGVESALVGIARHPVLGEYGLFGLGTLARRLRESKSLERGRKVEDLLIVELKFASTDAERIRVLTGISNVGSLRLLGQIRPFLDDPNEKVVGAAVGALRLVPGEQVDKLLALALAHDSRDVRRGALEAVKNRPRSNVIVAATLQMARVGEESDRVRAIRILGRWQGDDPKVRSALTALATTDESAQVRKAASAALPG